jgi:lipopolysaccharide biosynthesis glycosyltransferase
VSWLSSANMPSQTSYLTAARTPEPLVFVLLMLGASTAQEGSQLLKSILMHSSTPVHLHIICTSDAVPVLWRRFALVNRPAYELEVTLYQVERDQVVQRAQRAGLGGNYWQLAKLFMHEIVPEEVERAIYVDADMLFVRAYLSPLFCLRALIAP